jgi:selenocysteine lyase/cysteine desulfurase
MFKTKNSKFNVVSMEEEFPSNTVPFEYQSIEMRYVKHDNHRYDINHILSLCDENTLAVVTSYVQYCTGFRQDLYELGRELKKRDILFIVNATQAFPFFDIDINEMNIDVMTASVHKWGLCGHIGTLFITSEKFRTNYKSPIAGWLSVDVSASDNFIHNEKGVPFKLWDNAQQFQFGSSNLKNKLMLKYSLEYLNNIGIKQCRDYLLYISDYLLQALSNLDIEIISPHNSIKERSAIVSFSLKHGSNKKLVEYLENKRIIVALRNGYVRASVNIFTNKNDVDNLINAVLEYRLLINTSLSISGESY